MLLAGHPNAILAFSSRIRRLSLDQSNVIFAAVHLAMVHQMFSESTKFVAKVGKFVAKIGGVGSLIERFALRCKSSIKVSKRRCASADKFSISLQSWISLIDEPLRVWLPVLLQIAGAQEATACVLGSSYAATLKMVWMNWR